MLVLLDRHCLIDMGRGWRILAACWLVCQSIALSGQESQALYPAELSLSALTTEDGLPNNSVNVVVQDSLGFLWIGTWEGLAKYDGYEVVTYRTNPLDSSSLSNNRIETLLMDASGQLWVGTWDGINRYDLGCDCFERYRLDHQGNPLGQINALIDDQAGGLWLGTQQGLLLRFDKEEGTFSPYLNGGSSGVDLTGQQIRTLLIDHSNHLWIGTGEPFNPMIVGDGLYRLHLPSGRVKRFQGAGSGLIDDRISSMHQDRRGGLWVGTCRSGLHQYDQENEVFVALEPGRSDVYAPEGVPGPWSACPPVTFVHEDRAGKMWIGTYNGGVARFDPVTRQYQLYRHDPRQTPSLGGEEVWSCFEDRTGILWIASHSGGLQKIDPSARKFRSYTYDVAHPSGISHPFITGLQPSVSNPHSLWIGTQAGLNRLDRRTGEVTVYANDPTIPASLSSNTIWALCQDQAGIVWIGTDRGLDRLDPGTGRFRHYLTNLEDERVFQGNTILAIHESPSGLLWVSSWSGRLYSFDPSTGRHRAYRFAQRSGSASEGRIYHIFEDDEGVLWLSTYLDALYRFNPRTGDSQPHLQGIGANWVLQDEDKTFWVATSDRGLIHFDPATGELIESFTTHEGLPSNTIFSIFQDHEGWFWLSSGKGLSRFDPASSQFINYNTGDGLPDNSFNISSGAQQADGTIFFGGTAGVVEIHPTQVQRNVHAPSVVLTGLGIHDVARSSTSHVSHLPVLGEDVTLRHSENDLTFDYVGLHFSHPANNHYRYRLDPYDDDWISAGNRRSARYTSLKPGMYTFRVTAANSDGIWNEQGSSLRFEIATPWWNAWWFWILLGLSLAALAYAVYRFRIRQIKREAQTKLAFERRLLHTEMSALRAQMNPHFLYNCLNSIDHYIIKNETEKASDYLGRFSRLMRLTLQNSRSRTVPLKDDLEALRLYLEMESLRFPGTFEYEISVSDQVSDDLTEVPPMLIQPFVENAILHGLKPKPGGGKVTIEAFHENEHLCLTIEDNGIGRAKAQELAAQRRRSKRRSYGMQITQERVQMFNDLYGGEATIDIIDLTDDEGQPAGTRVEVELPA